MISIADSWGPRLANTAVATAIGAGQVNYIRGRIRELGPNAIADPRDGSTMLHVAVACRQKEITRVLLEAGADVNATDHTGQTPIYGVNFHKRDDAILKLLLDHGATPRTRADSRTPLQKAAYCHWLRGVELLLAAGDNASNYLGEQSPIVYALSSYAARNSDDSAAELDRVVFALAYSGSGPASTMRPQGVDLMGIAIRHSSAMMRLLSRLGARVENLASNMMTINRLGSEGYYWENDPDDINAKKMDRLMTLLLLTRRLPRASRGYVEALVTAVTARNVGMREQLKMLLGEVSHDELVDALAELDRRGVVSRGTELIARELSRHRDEIMTHFRAGHGTEEPGLDDLLRGYTG
jgi:CRP-like cAMP-binding protein